MAQRMLVTGGAASGKSHFAEGLMGAFKGRLCYLATAQPVDVEMEERIRRHRARRGENWDTVEEPLMLPQTLARVDGVYSAILIDCVTVWLSNQLLSYDENDPEAEESVLGSVHRLCGTLRSMTTPVVMVTNEVGLSLVPEYRLGRLFRDISGQANQIIASACDEVHLVVSGLSVKLK